jgi:SNF2 family DNA or RNA helicase
LNPWNVSVIRLTREQVVEILCACVGKQNLAPGLIVGSDLSFWARAMRFAGALITRQKYLPTITEDNGTCYAQWKPVFTGADVDILEKLAKAMPAAARALTQGDNSPPNESSRSTLADFTGEIVDHLVRAPCSSSVMIQKRGRRRKVPTFSSMHDQWLHALRSPDGLMEGDEGELAQLKAQVCDWQRLISLPTSAPFRLCFRLEEPGIKMDGTEMVQSAEGAWYVRYLLQSVNDPSLLIPATEAWSTTGKQKSLLDLTGFDHREYVLLSLGQASMICPHIEGSLRTVIPGGYELDTAEAYKFLTEKAMVLEEAGFKIMLPAWWTRKGTKLRLKASANARSPVMTGHGRLSLESVVEFDWEVALGGEKISLAELQELAKLKAPLIRFRGQWVQMTAEEIEAARDFWKEKASGRATVHEIIRMALGAARTPSSIDFEGVRATGWLADLLKQLEEGTPFEELPHPESFQGRLRPYQIRGYSWLSFLRRWGLGACLADDMGLGKTVQTLALIQRDWLANSHGPVLLVCPMSVIATWLKEAGCFTPELPIMVHHGASRLKSEVFEAEAGKHAMVVTSYALLHRDFEIFKGVPWAGMVLDEAQNIKNPETKQARSARAIGSSYRIALTGTPVENNVGDLWSIMEFLNPGLLGTQTEFKRNFFIPIQADRDQEAMQSLKRLTGPFILRRLKTDKAIIADLPEKMEMKVFCTLTKEQASLYAAVVDDVSNALDSVEGIERKGVILATLSKLKQVCNHPRQFLGDNSEIHGRSGKLSRLTEMLEEVIEVGDRALIFTQFAEMGEILKCHLQEWFGREVLFLHGGVPKARRDQMVERFQTDAGGLSIFILSLKAGGLGLNLQRANHVFHFDRWWNPAVENQATDRAFRIGQKRNVQVHKFLCAGTLEEKIDEMIESKKEIAQAVVGVGEGWLTELSTNELREFFKLRKEAWGD